MGLNLTMTEGRVFYGDTVADLVAGQTTNIILNVPVKVINVLVRNAAGTKIADNFNWTQPTTGNIILPDLGDMAGATVAITGVALVINTLQTATNLR